MEKIVKECQNDFSSEDKGTTKRNYIFCAIVFVLCLRHVLQLVGASTIASYLFISLYGLVFLFVLESLIAKFSLRQSNVALFVFFCGAFACLFVLVYISAVWSDYFLESLVFILSFPLILCCDTISISKKDSKFFFSSLMFVEIVLVVMMFLPSSYKDGLLLLYTPNANQAGLLYMSIFLGGYTYKYLNRKGLFGWILLVGLFVGCWLTGSRTAVACCILCVVISLLLSSRPKWNWRIMIAAIVLFVIFPILVAIISSNIDVSTKSMFEEIFSGRHTIWRNIIEHTTEHPISINIDRVLADHYGEELGAHNVLMDVLWKYSLPVAVIFLVSIAYLGRQMASSLTQKRTSVISACFVAGLIHMTFEASLISGALDYTLYFLIAIWAGIGFLNKNEEENE